MSSIRVPSDRVRFMFVFNLTSFGWIKKEIYAQICFVQYFQILKPDTASAQFEWGFLLVWKNKSIIYFEKKAKQNVESQKHQKFKDWKLTGTVPKQFPMEK